MYTGPIAGDPETKMQSRVLQNEAAVKERRDEIMNNAKDQVGK